MSKAEIVLSIVVPMYNEAANLDAFFQRTLAVVEGLHLTYEIVCINDGSQDNTLALLLTYHQHNPNIKIINLSRNFGKEIALSAGLDYVSGAAVIPIDADLQDPPELIAELIDMWQQGYDMVYATRRRRKGETLVKRVTARFFYQFIDFISEIRIPKNTGDFRLMDRRVVDALQDLPERTRFMKGLFAWVGFKQTAVTYDREPRSSGQTTWNYWRLWNFALDGITSFSAFPLKVWSYLGVFISLFSIFYALFLIIRTLIWGIDVPGYASMMVVILFLGGIQLITLGILGEYLARIYTEVKRRPLYLIRETHGFEIKDKTG